MKPAAQQVPSASGLVDYPALRGDWYRGGDLMARLLARAAGGEALHFRGFPAQWIPLFEHFGIAWSAAIAPPAAIPLASELGADRIGRLHAAAAARGQSRSFIEAWVAVDPLLADVLHRLDRRSIATKAEETHLPLTGWQAYGRPEVQAFDRLVLASARAEHDILVVLPCARGRPYDRSRTHRRIWRRLEATGVSPQTADAVVMSSIGLVPRGLWDHPVALHYDSGVPDIWRVLRLARAFFGRVRYGKVVDCLEFAPYSECLEILAREGAIGPLVRGSERRVRRLPRP